MSMHYRVNGYMTLDTCKPGYQIVGQKVKGQGHWGKCKKLFCVYRRQKRIDFHQTKTKTIQHTDFKRNNPEIPDGI